MCWNTLILCTSRCNEHSSKAQEKHGWCAGIFVLHTNAFRFPDYHLPHFISFFGSFQSISDSINMAGKWKGVHPLHATAWPHQCWVGGRTLLLIQPRTPLAFFVTYVQLGVPQDHQVYFCKAAFQLVISQHVLLHRKETKKLSWKSQNNQVSWTYMKDPAYNTFVLWNRKGLINKKWGGKQIMTPSKRFCVERKAKTKPRKEKKMLCILFLYH